MSGIEDYMREKMDDAERESVTDAPRQDAPDFEAACAIAKREIERPSASEYIRALARAYLALRERVPNEGERERLTVALAAWLRVELGATGPARSRDWAERILRYLDYFDASPLRERVPSEPFRLTDNHADDCGGMDEVEWRCGCGFLQRAASAVAYLKSHGITAASLAPHAPEPVAWTEDERDAVKWLDRAANANLENERMAAAMGDSANDRAFYRHAAMRYRTLFALIDRLYATPPQRAGVTEGCAHHDGPCECGPEGFGLRDDDRRVNRPSRDTTDALLTLIDEDLAVLSVEGHDESCEVFDNPDADWRCTCHVNYARRVLNQLRERVAASRVAQGAS